METFDPLKQELSLPVETYLEKKIVFKRMRNI